MHYFITQTQYRIPVQKLERLLELDQSCFIPFDYLILEFAWDPASYVLQSETLHEFNSDQSLDDLLYQFDYEEEMPQDSPELPWYSVEVHGEDVILDVTAIHGENAEEVYPLDPILVLGSNGNCFLTYEDDLGISAVVYCEGYEADSSDENPVPFKRWIDTNRVVCGAAGVKNAREILEEFVPYHKHLTDKWTCEIYSEDTGETLDLYSLGEMMTPEQKRKMIEEYDIPDPFAKDPLFDKKQDSGRKRDLVDELIEWVYRTQDLPADEIGFLADVITQTPPLRAQLLVPMTDLRNQDFSKSEIFEGVWPVFYQNIQTAFKILQGMPVPPESPTTKDRSPFVFSKTDEEDEEDEKNGLYDRDDLPF